MLIKVLLFQGIKYDQCKKHIIQDVRQIKAVEHCQRPYSEHDLQSLFKWKVSVLYDFMQHLLIVSKPLSLISQTLHLS
jgi:hypothetical protein